MRAPLPSPLLLALGGCWLRGAEIEGTYALDTSTDLAEADTDTDTDTDTDADTDTDTDTDTDADTDPSLACIDDDLASEVGLRVASGSNLGAGDDFAPTCVGAAGAGGADVAIAWTAPTTGCWGFRTSGSSFDTVAYVLDGCDGETLACNDDFNKNIASSEASLALTAGQTVVVVIDGFDASATGTWSLDIGSGVQVAWDVDIGSTVGNGAMSGTNVGQDTTLAPVLCTYASGRDVILRWVAPATDVWTFELDPFFTNFDSVLSLHRQCAWDAFACEDEPVPVGGEVATALIYAGEEVFLRIAGYDDGGGAETGSFRLDITR